MASPPLKLLVAEDEDDLREILAHVLESQFNATVLQARTGQEAIKLLEANPDVFCISSDYSMPDGTDEDVYRYVLEKKLKAHFILCTAYQTLPNTLFEKNPIAGTIHKPNVLQPLLYLVRSLLEKNNIASQPAQRYCRVGINTLLNCGLLESDIYMKLTDGKFVKVFHAKDVFDEEDFNRFASKHINTLFFETEDASRLLSNYLLIIQKAALNKEASAADQLKMAAFAIELIQDITVAFGVTPETKKLIHQSVGLTISSLQKSPKLSALLETFEQFPESYVALHSVALAHTACAIAGMMGWKSDVTFFKLSMAAFLHDITLENHALARCQTLGDVALLSPPVSEEEAARFAKHPDESAKLLREIGDVPADIDTIILQHHERPDGSGFPNKLDCNKISPLGALFIIAHDLLLFKIGNKGADTATFLAQLDPSFKKGAFKDIVKALTTSAVQATSG